MATAARTRQVDDNTLAILGRMILEGNTLVIDKPCA